ncbi:MAG: hypothetical protein H0W56_01425 [Acidothermales bacterium]|jgi:hypothetical protein|nr:hypothetical protein [Acidothermales bacterium]
MITTPPVSGKPGQAPAALAGARLPAGPTRRGAQLNRHGKALGRSSGAVGNALIKLAGNGTITETSVKPRRYTVQP